MAEEAQSSKTTISLRTVDGDISEVSPAIVKHMKTVQSFIEDDSSTVPIVIPLPNVNTFEISKIVDYLDYHHSVREGKASDTAVGNGDKEAKEFNAQFVEQMNGEQLKEVLLAANYLNVKDLVDFLSQTVADSIKDKTVEFVREYFGIDSDYTPEEEAKYREDNKWAFQGVDEDQVIHSLIELVQRIRT